MARTGLAAVAASLLLVVGACAGEQGERQDEAQDQAQVEHLGEEDGEREEGHVEQADGEGREPGEELADRTFLATAFTEDGEPVDLFDGVPVSFEFVGRGRLVVGAACYKLNATVTIDADRIELRQLSLTVVGSCDEAERRRWLETLLAMSPAWALDGDELTLTVTGDSGVEPWDDLLGWETAEVVLVDQQVAED